MKDEMLYIVSHEELGDFEFSSKKEAIEWIRDLSTDELIDSWGNYYDICVEETKAK